jgi:hypothetical protein
VINPFDTFNSWDGNYTNFIRGQVADMAVGESRFIKSEGEESRKFSGSLRNVGINFNEKGAKFSMRKPVDEPPFDGFWVKRIL